MTPCPPQERLKNHASRSPKRRVLSLCHGGYFWGYSLMCLFLVASYCGCHRLKTHIGPGTITNDRVPYNNAISSSWKEQTLLNIVKLRYVEPPFFIDVPQIVSGYSLERSINGSLGVQSAPNLNIPTDERILGVMGFNTTLADRPTIAYSPQTTAQFIRNLSKPLPPLAVLGLLESGYKAEAILGLSLQSINGFRNKSAAGGEFRPADPEFLEVLNAINQAQQIGGLGIRFEQVGLETQKLYIQFANEPTPSAAIEIDRLRELLGLDPEQTQFEVVYGSVANDPTKIVIKTRPIYLILRDLSPFVNVPEEHLTAGLALSFDTSGVATPPLEVCCGCEPPADCFASVCYRGRYFWIEHGHAESKRTFSYLLVMLALADTNPKQASPTVTIQAN